MLLKWLLGIIVYVILHYPAWAENTIKVGVLGAMSGPAKYWGLTNKYCALATAHMYNQQGGISVGANKYKIQIISVDTTLDPTKAKLGAKKLIEDENVKYIIGPNIDDTSLAIIPLIEAHDVINIAYGFSKKLYQAPRKNTYLGMIHPSQTAPSIYKYLIQSHRIKSVSFLARFDKESLNQRNFGIKIAQDLGLEIKDIDAWDIKDITYNSYLEEIEGLAKSYSELNPDLIVLSGVTPSDTGKIIQALRAQQYSGFLSTETAQDPQQLLTLGEAANGFVSLGSSTPKNTHTEYMKQFKKTYASIAGEWHDEAGVKAYALETILRVIQRSGEKAITNTDLFRKTISEFETPDPFSNIPRTLKLVGEDIFGEKKQINVPFTVNMIENNTIKSDAF